jgi:hypothetical protein
MDQQPIQPVQNLQPETQLNKPTKKSWPIAVLVVAGILVLGGITYGAYYFWQNSTGKLSQSPSPSVSASTSPSATPDETAGWQTYWNDDWGYSFKYPKNQIVVCYADKEKVLLFFNSISACPDSGTDTAAGISIFNYN